MNAKWGRWKGRLAHNDTAIAMDQEVLPGVTRKMIDEAVDGIAKLYNDILLALNDTTILFDVLKEEKAADALVKVLDAGNDKLDADAAARRERYK